MKNIILQLKRLTSSHFINAAVVLAVVAPWFFLPGHLFFTDFVRGPVINIDWAKSSLLLHLVWSGLASFLSSAFVEKIFITAVLALVILGGRSLATAAFRFVGGEERPSGLLFVVSLFALFNPFVYDRALYGQFGVLISYGCLLFVFAYLLEIYRSLEFRRLWRTGIFTGLALMFSVHSVFFLALFFLIFFVALFFRYRQVAFKLSDLWRALALFVLTIVALNANWLYAMASGQSRLTEFVEQGISAQDIDVFQTSGRTPGEAYTNVIFMSGFWGKDQYRYADLTVVSGWQKGFIFLLPLIIYGVYLSFRGRTRGEKIFSTSLLVLYVLAIILAVGTKSPVTGPFTQFLYDHLPFYKGLREPQKWVAVIIPIYLFYLTLALARLYRSKFISDKRWLAGTLLGLVIIMQAPLLLWGFAGQAKPTPYPDDWIATDRLLVDRSADSYGCSDRILFLPWHLYLSFYWSGKIMANPAPHFFSCPVLSGTNMEWGGIYDNSLNPDGAAVSAWLAERGVNGPPAVAGKPLRYIILAKEVDFTSYLWLNDLPYLTPISESLRLVVYEIK